MTYYTLTFIPTGCFFCSKHKLYFKITSKNAVSFFFDLTDCTVYMTVLLCCVLVQSPQLTQFLFLFDYHYLFSVSSLVPSYLYSLFSSDACLLYSVLWLCYLPVYVWIKLLILLSLILKPLRSSLSLSLQHCVTVSFYFCIVMHSVFSIVLFLVVPFK